MNESVLVNDKGKEKIDDNNFNTKVFFNLFNVIYLFIHIFLFENINIFINKDLDHLESIEQSNEISFVNDNDDFNVKIIFFYFFICIIYLYLYIYVC